jgi:hypothetical protein
MSAIESGTIDVATFQGSRNPYFEAAMTTAINDWVRAEFPDRDARLRGSIGARVPRQSGPNWCGHRLRSA